MDFDAEFDDLSLRFKRECTITQLNTLLTHPKILQAFGLARLTAQTSEWLEIPQIGRSSLFRWLVDCAIISSRNVNPILDILRPCLDEHPELRSIFNLFENYQQKLTPGKNVVSKPIDITEKRVLCASPSGKAVAILKYAEEERQQILRIARLEAA